MILIILGSSSDEKGSQLEKLTAALLSKMDYRNIVTNEIGPGGEEIDVVAEFQAPTLAGTEVLRVICECKAYKVVATTTDWLKFLGKILVEEGRHGQLLLGCFIALSGVNGNVAGSYQDIKKTRSNIKLVTGDQLTTLISSIYPLCSLDKISENISRYTRRARQRIELAYYNQMVYWIIVFENDAYTLLRADGALLETSEADILRPLVEATIPSHSYIDMREEAEAQKRVDQVKKRILGQLMVEGGSTTLAKVQSEISGFSNEEVRAAVSALTTLGWIIYDESSEVVVLLDDQSDRFYEHWIKILLFLFAGNITEHIVNSVIGSSYYDQHVNEALVQEIQRIQGDLPLSAEDTEEAIQLMRLTPSGLVYAIQPDLMLMGHRQEPELLSDERTNAFDRNYFFRTLYRSLGNDFRVHVLNRYFFAVRGLREFEIDTKIIVKSQTAPVIETKIHERVGVGELVEEAGGGHVTVLMYEDAPEPWEHPALQQGHQNVQSKED